MTLHPDVLSRAQKDIDAVIGSERLITYDDRASLPYIEALYRETLRWRPVAPLSVAHATTSDDIYKGYYIPKGSPPLVLRVTGVNTLIFLSNLRNNRILQPLVR